MRKAIFLMLCCGYLSLAYAQPSNDFCINAESVELQTPGPCPGSSAVSDTILLDNTGATASEPFTQLPGCTVPGADVWLKFTTQGNSMQFILRGPLAGLQLILYQGSSCGSMYPVACASGQSSIELLATVDRNVNYYLLVSGQGVEDQGEMQLIINSTNFCNPCLTQRQGFFSASPAPLNGTYTGGQSVQMCYTVNRWNAAASNEYLHGLEVDFGPGWDQSTFSPAPPPTCNPSGNWDWYQSWTSVTSGQSFGPGFAYDSNDFGFLDGNPGNNRGMGGSACSNIGITSDQLQFCWTITTNDCPEDEYGYFDALDVTTRMLGDGISGAWNQTQCFIPYDDNFLAATYCPDPFVPEITVINASCTGVCDGEVYFSSTGDGPWDYALTDTSGILYYASSNNTAPDTVTSLCAGEYIATIVDLPSGEVRTIPVSIMSSEAPVASATYELPCYEGEPIQLSGSSTPSAGASYEWFGPNGFYSTNQNPLALYPGIYTLVVTIDGCESEPFELEVPPISTPVVDIEQDTIIACPDEPLTISATGTASNYNWFLEGGNASLGTESSLTINPEDGAVYIVNGTNEAGCAGTDQVLILVPFDPAVTTDNSGIVCPFTEVTITASGGQSYNWSTGDTTNSITVSPEFTGLYYVTITGESCTTSLPVNVPVSNSPSIMAGSDQTLCQGESATLFASGGESVLWSTGETTNSISVTPDTTTTYIATITDANVCEHEEAVTVTVFPTPDLTIVPADTVSVCEGDTAAFVILEGGSPYWDTLVSPAQTTTYQIPGAETFGCQELGTFTVIVNSLPDVDILGDGLLCGADSTLLVASGEGSFTWSTGEEGDSIYVSPTGTQTYSVTATSSEGCSQSAETTVSQASPPAAPAVNCNATLSQVSFSWVSDPALTYGLSVLEGPIGVAIGNNQYIVNNLEPGQSVTISLTVTNEDGCSATTEISCAALECAEVTLSLSPPSTVCITAPSITLEAEATNGTNTGMDSWSGPGLIGNLFDPAVAGAGEHLLIYSYTENACTLSDTTYIDVIPTLDEAMVNCQSAGDSMVFSWPYIAADSAYEVVVLSGQEGYHLDATTFVVNEVEAGDTAIISIIPLGNDVCGLSNIEASCWFNPCQPLTLRPDTIACTGAEIQLWADSTDWDTYQWSPATGLSCTDCPAPLATVSQTTTYTLIASNLQGCTDTASVTIYVGDLPPEYIPDEPITFCLGEPFEICMPDGDVEIWIGPGGFVSTGPCLSFDSMTTANVGNYYAYLRIGGCRFGKNFSMEAAPEIEIGEFTDFQAVCPDSTFKLFVESPNAVSYLWEPGEYLDCPDCPEAQGSLPQTATFTLTMTDAFGCTREEAATVFVDDCTPAPLIGTPYHNVEETVEGLRFYPNPAKQAVQLEMPMEGVKQIRLFNAAGQQVYETRSNDRALTIPLNNLNSGPYLLSITTELGTQNEWLLISR